MKIRGGREGRNLVGHYAQLQVHVPWTGAPHQCRKASQRAENERKRNRGGFCETEGGGRRVTFAERLNQMTHRKA